jgi:hypothetical protein
MPPLVTPGGPATHEVAVTVKVQVTDAVVPAIVQPVNWLLPEAAVQVTPTNGDALKEPDTSALVHATFTPVDEIVVGPPVAVKVVSPILLHVTAPALAAPMANSDRSVAMSTPTRAILFMVVLLFVRAVQRHVLRRKDQNATNRVSSPVRIRGRQSRSA